MDFCTMILCAYLEMGSSWLHIHSTDSGKERIYGRNELVNPLTDIALGLEWTPTRNFAASIEIRHESMIQVHDSGEDGVRISMRFYFGR